MAGIAGPGDGKVATPNAASVSTICRAHQAHFGPLFLPRLHDTF